MADGSAAFAQEPDDGPQPIQEPLPQTERWPPDYTRQFYNRDQRLDYLRCDDLDETGRVTVSRATKVMGAKEYYRTRCIEWIEDWGFTADPRNAGIPGRITNMPFIMFPRQRELCQFILACLDGETDGLIEKCRDMGATWICVGVSDWLWRFWPGVSVGWGSRKQEYVDRKGDMDSIFEKLRAFGRMIPSEFQPKGWNERFHSTEMKIFNPENGSSITGEIGDSIGRGGRKRVYFKDEAQPLTVRILTPTGWSTMGEMRVGAKIIGPDGQTRAVTHINDCGEHDVYRVTLSDGTSTECSEHHLWTVDRVWGARRRETLTLERIKADLAYVSPGGHTQYRYRLPVTAPVEFARGAALPLDPYLVGALLGDGAIGGGCVRITTADKEIVQSFRELLPEGVIVGAYDGRYGHNIVAERGRWGRETSPARDVVRAAGIYGLGTADKHIPDAYKFAPIADRLAVLQGLMDTDGCAHKVASFHSTSARLAEDVRFVVESLGGTATHDIKPDHRGYKDVHVLHINLPAGMVPFRLARKIASLSPRKHPAGRTIISIEKTGRREVRCITVDAEDGLYLTDHCIVTHNSAHYAHPELVQSALDDNTRCQMDISSVNGPGNVFHRKRDAGIEWRPGQPAAKGVTNVLVMDWRDHPAKDQVWYDRRRAKAIKDGLLHKFEQEVNRNYYAAVQGVIVNSEHLKACIDAHLNPALKSAGWEDGPWHGALDVADNLEGTVGDRNAGAFRKGVVLRELYEWNELDVGATTRRAVAMCMSKGSMQFDYDSIGMGSAVKAERNRLEADNLMPKGVRFVPWDAGASPIGAELEDTDPKARVIHGDKDSPLVKDFYANFKAQGWWELQQRCWRTYQCVQAARMLYPVDELISIPSNLPHRLELEKEFCQPTRGLSGAMKMLVNKAPEGTKSPNLGDAVMMNYWPAKVKAIMAISDEVLNRTRRRALVR